MLSSLRTKNVNCDQEAKFIQDRVIGVERNITEICHAFREYSKALSKIKDKGDQIAHNSIKYAQYENVNKSLSNGLMKFATSFIKISEYGDFLGHSIEEKVVNELSQYENICKHVKIEVKQIYIAKEKEQVKRKQLDRIKNRNTRNRQEMIQAEAELVKASGEVSKATHNLEEQITTFERQKLCDIKNILLDFLSIEMGYHARALEILTTAYQDVNAIDEETDLQDFKKCLHTEQCFTNELKGALFKDPHLYGSMGNLFFASGKKRSPGIPKPHTQTSCSNISKSQETLDSMKYSIEDSTDSDAQSEEDSNSIVNEDILGREARTSRKYLN